MSYLDTLDVLVQKNARLTWVALLSLASILLVVVVTWGATSGFSNSPTSIRRYIVGPDGRSLDEKVHEYQQSGASGLTGSRDVPVFFSDFNVEMGRDANGDLVAQRETFTNEKVNDVRDIEQRFMVN